MFDPESAFREATKNNGRYFSWPTSVILNLPAPPARANVGRMLGIQNLQYFSWPTTLFVILASPARLPFRSFM